MKTPHCIGIVALVASASLIAFSADEKPRGPGGGREGERKGGDPPIEDLATLFRTDVPAHPLDVVLGRPTKSSITVSVLAYSDREGVVHYGPRAGALASKTAAFALKAGEPAEVALMGCRATPEGRGGSEAAPFYEWGGKNQDGTDGFAEHRPAWPAPIHQLLVQNRVNIVFHGHDHIFARQDLDGIVYQEVPQPGNPDQGGRDSVPRTAAEYGYLSGKILGSPGYLRITVAPDKVTADLVRSYLPESEGAGRKNHEVAFSYSIPAQ